MSSSSSPQSPPLSQSSVPSTPTLVSSPPLPSSQAPPAPPPPEQQSLRASLLAMPLPRSNSAPRFDASQPKSVGRFFEDLELAFERAGITDDALRKRLTFHYIPIEVEDLWRLLPEASTTSEASFDDFKMAVIALYPEYIYRRMFSFAHLERLVREWRVRCIDNLDDYGRFYRSFVAIAGVLRQKGALTPTQEARLFRVALSSSRMLEAVDCRLERLAACSSRFVLTRERVHEVVLSVLA
ncbi:hypothetical protein C8Q73DRAFT_836935 [Cubamyces lactineus]|nr:hypothetical protein C8Q73DRAFT_836935 [Cubamyces lactineus]